MEESAFLPESDGKDGQTGSDGRLDATSTAVSADGPLNLYNAVAVAADPQAKGRGAGGDERLIHAAHSLTNEHHGCADVHVPIRGLVGDVIRQNDYYESGMAAHDQD
jgi:L-asparaginase